MSWPAESRNTGHAARLHAALRLEPLPERLPWQVAAVVILGLSALLWGVAGYGLVQLLG
jgi:predicted anti-sigma-YlaC factor YlaD